MANQTIDIYQNKYQLFEIFHFSANANKEVFIKKTVLQAQ